jgi:hypothetical protein
MGSRVQTPGPRKKKKKEDKGCKAHSENLKRDLKANRENREKERPEELKSPEGWNHYIPFPSSFCPLICFFFRSLHSPSRTFPLYYPSSPSSSSPPNPKALSFKPSQAVDTHVPDPLHEDPMRTLGKPPPRTRPSGA